MIHVHVAAWGDRRRHLPAAERDTGAALKLRDDATIIHLRAVLKLPCHSTWLIGVNDAIVGLDHALHDGDQIELMLPIEGGMNTGARDFLKRIFDQDYERYFISDNQACGISIRMKRMNRYFRKSARLTPLM